MPSGKSTMPPEGEVTVFDASDVASAAEAFTRDGLVVVRVLSQSDCDSLILEQFEQVLLKQPWDTQHQLCIKDPISGRRLDPRTDRDRFLEVVKASELSKETLQHYRDCWPFHRGFGACCDPVVFHLPRVWAKVRQNEALYDLGAVLVGTPHLWVDINRSIHKLPGEGDESFLHWDCNIFTLAAGDAGHTQSPPDTGNKRKLQVATDSDIETARLLRSSKASQKSPPAETRPSKRKRPVQDSTESAAAAASSSSAGAAAAAAAARTRPPPDATAATSSTSEAHQTSLVQGKVCYTASNFLCVLGTHTPERQHAIASAYRSLYPGLQSKSTVKIGLDPSKPDPMGLRAAARRYVVPAGCAVFWSPLLLHGTVKLPKDNHIEFGTYVGYMPAEPRPEYKRRAKVDELADRLASYTRGCAPQLWPGLDRIHYYPHRFKNFPKLLQAYLNKMPADHPFRTTRTNGKGQPVPHLEPQPAPDYTPPALNLLGRRLLGMESWPGGGSEKEEEEEESEERTRVTKRYKEQEQDARAS